MAAWADYCNKPLTADAVVTPLRKVVADA